MNKHEELLLDIVKTVNRYSKCDNLDQESWFNTKYKKFVGKRCTLIGGSPSVRYTYISDLAYDVGWWAARVQPNSSITYPNNYFRKRAESDK